MFSLSAVKCHRRMFKFNLNFFPAKAKQSAEVKIKVKELSDLKTKYGTKIINYNSFTKSLKS